MKVLRPLNKAIKTEPGKAKMERESIMKTLCEKIATDFKKLGLLSRERHHGWGVSEIMINDGSQSVKLSFNFDLKNKRILILQCKNQIDEYAWYLLKKWNLTATEIMADCVYFHLPE